jgi:hypothetical protein
VKAAVQKIAFDNDGAFIRETRREVEQYLARGSTRLNGLLLLYAKAPVAIGPALRSHFLHLRAMGRLGFPAEIEMG